MLVFIAQKIKKIFAELPNIVCGSAMDKIFFIQDKVAKFDKEIAFYLSIWLFIKYFETLETLFLSPTFWINILHLILS